MESQCINEHIINEYYKYSFRVDKKGESRISSEIVFVMKIEYKNFLFTYHIDNFYFEDYQLKSFVSEIRKKNKVYLELIPESCTDVYDKGYTNVIPHILYNPETDENNIIFEHKSYQRNAYGTIFRIMLPYDNYIIDSFEEFYHFIMDFRKNNKTNKTF